MNIASPLLRRLGLIALSSILSLLAVTITHANPLQSLADKKAPLPITASFTKGTPGENGGPYAVKLTNTSNAALTVNVTIIWSVASHNRARTIKLPPHEIAAGESWSIDDLAVEDRLLLTADGFEDLDLTTPPGK